jgi:AcrR family transcriptional regulator
MGTKVTPRRRPYRSARREQQAAETRAAVLAAASELFEARGWAATSMREVASAAGVSVETIYASHGNKSTLLLAAVDAGIVGDLDPVALRERDDFTALARGGLGERVAALARLVTGIHERTSGLFLALREAAVGDPALASRLAELEEARRSNATEALTLVAGHAVAEEQRDGLWAIGSVEVFRLLTQESGWNTERYAAWLADILVRQLSPDQPAVSG